MVTKTCFEIKERDRSYCEWHDLYPFTKLCHLLLYNPLWKIEAALFWIFLFAVDLVRQDKDRITTLCFVPIQYPS